MKKYLLTTLLLALSLTFTSAQVTGDLAPDEASGGCTTLSYNLTYKKSKDANTNGEVSDLQYFLQDQGLLGVDPNGLFGPSTLRAVKSFQKKYGFISSGYVGPVTRAKIQSISCANDDQTNEDDSNDRIAPPVCSSIGGVGCVPTPVETAYQCPDGRIVFGNTNACSNGNTVEAVKNSMRILVSDGQYINLPLNTIPTDLLRTLKTSGKSKNAYLFLSIEEEGLNTCNYGLSGVCVGTIGDGNVLFKDIDAKYAFKTLDQTKRYKIKGYLSYQPPYTECEPAVMGPEGSKDCTPLYSKEDKKIIQQIRSSGSVTVGAVTVETDWFTVTTKIVTSSRISATINSSAFDTSMPNLTGTASGLSGVRLTLNIGKNIQYSSPRIEVAGNGSWSYQVTQAIPAGAYRAVITSADPRVSEDVVVAEGLVNITGNNAVNNQVISATIDQSSLTTISTTPTITGTATGDAIFGINITNDNDQRLYSSKLSVVNGRWSLKVSPSLPSGAYPVHVYATPMSGDTTKNLALISGILTIQSSSKNNDVAQCPTYESKPIITSITPSSGPIGTTVEIKGCNFLGFEGDKVIWFKNSKGETGILNGAIDEVTRTSNTVMKVTIPRTLCRTMNWYSGLDCSLLELAPDTYTIYSQSYGGSSNVVNFSVVATPVNIKPVPKVISPNNGETFSLGKDLYVKWDINTVPQGAEFLVTLAGEGREVHIARVAHGVRSVIVPLYTTRSAMQFDPPLVPGKYKVRVALINVPEPESTSDEADQSITILPELTLSMISGQTQVLGAYATCVDIPRNIYRGDESASVTMLQKFLKEKGYFNESVTGVYRDKTVEAVKDYQASKGLPETGMVYDFTRQAIKGETCQ